MNIKKTKKLKTALIAIAAVLFWTFIVCFPNPYIFFRNIYRYFRFPIDPSITEIIQGEIPDDPVEIEKFVRNTIKYKFDWQNYGFPDYVATPRQAVMKGEGDCEDRAAVLASLLEAKKIPYNLKASIVHFWVDYPGKRPSRSENEDVSFFGKVDGKHRLKLPDFSQWKRYLEVGKEGAWDVMPLYRKIIMIAGWLIIISMSIVWIKTPYRSSSEPEPHSHIKPKAIE